MTNKEETFFEEAVAAPPDAPFAQVLVVTDGDGTLCAVDFAGYETRLARLLTRRFGAHRVISARSLAIGPVDPDPSTAYRRSELDLVGMFFGYDYQMLLIIWRAAVIGTAGPQPRGPVRLSECLNG